MNDIEKRLKELREEEQELLHKQTKARMKVLRLERKAKASIAREISVINSIGQFLHLGDRVVVVRGGGRSTIKPVVGTYAGANLGPEYKGNNGDEGFDGRPVKSLRVKVLKEVVTFIGADGKKSKYTWKLKAPVSRKVEQKEGIIAAPGHKVFAIR